MNRYIALLRAINVSGHAIIKMEDLRSGFSAAGCKNVKTYIQSGNVVFDHKNADPASLRAALEKKMSSLLGGPAVVLLRTGEEWDQLMKGDPFKTKKTATDAKLYVTFLSAPPVEKLTLPIVSEKDGLEFFGMKNLDIYCVSTKVKDGYGFPNIYIEKKTRVPATSRNWNTILKIQELASK